jgi:lipopolysaccharide export system protein LptA
MQHLIKRIIFEFNSKQVRNMRCKNVKFIHFCLISSTVLAAPSVVTANVANTGQGEGISTSVSINSDALSFDQKHGVIVFEGSVTAVQGDILIETARLTALYVDQDISQSLEEVLGSGGVVISRGDQKVIGLELVYDLSAGLAIVTGDVEVLQGSSRFTSDIATFDLTAGNILMEGAVRARFNPSDDIQ